MREPTKGCTTSTAAMRDRGVSKSILPATPIGRLGDGSIYGRVLAFEGITDKKIFILGAVQHSTCT